MNILFNCGYDVLVCLWISVWLVVIVEKGKKILSCWVYSFAHLWISSDQRLLFLPSQVWLDLSCLFSFSSMYATLRIMKRAFDNWSFCCNYFRCSEFFSFTGDTLSGSPLRTSTIYGVVGTIRLVVGRYACILLSWVCI